MSNANRMPRSRLLRKAQQLLERKGIPRVQMSLMVSGTGLAGFLALMLLLRFGLDAMWIRYGLAVLIAYGVFLFFVWLWVLYYRSHFGQGPTPLDSLDAADVVEVGLEAVDIGSELLPSAATVRVIPAAGLPAEMPPSEYGSDTVADLDLGFDLDELVIVIALIAAVCSALAAAVYVIYSAPVFFGEVMVDGVFSVGLYRSLREIDRRHWLEAAVVKTRFPIFWVVLFFVIAGAVMQGYAPEATSIGGVWQHYLSTAG